MIDPRRPQRLPGARYYNGPEDGRRPREPRAPDQAQMERDRLIDELESQGIPHELGPRSTPPEQFSDDPKAEFLEALRTADAPLSERMVYLKTPAEIDNESGLMAQQEVERRTPPPKLELSRPPQQPKAPQPNSEYVEVFNTLNTEYDQIAGRLDGLYARNQQPMRWPDKKALRAKIAAEEARLRGIGTELLSMINTDMRPKSSID